MAPIHVGIQFDKSSREYYAGEALDGTVILKLEKAMPIIGNSDFALFLAIIICVLVRNGL